MYSKPIPTVGKRYKYSNKKYKNPRSGQYCTVITVTPYNAATHNVLIEFEDGYRTITSKHNLFE